MCFTVLLVLFAAAVAWRRPASAWQWLRVPAVAAAALAVFPLVYLPTVIALIMIPVGAVMTALAGNPPINGADEDLIGMMPALAAGTVLGLLLAHAEPQPTGFRAGQGEVDPDSGQTRSTSP
jgi:hypothetical protein